MNLKYAQSYNPERTEKPVHKKNLGTKILEVGGWVLLGSALVIGIPKFCSSLSKNYLTEEDFKKSAWIDYYNSSGTIWHGYVNENIPKNQDNWQKYVSEVRKKNQNNLEGWIYLPDLDGDGKVGRQE